jgi:hypothetical protein
VAFSPDGQRLASGSEDMAIRIWIARTETLTEMVCEQVWRNLTWDEWRRFVGTDLPYERTCPNQPPGRGTPLEAPAPRSPESARRVPASNNAEARVMGFAPAD